MHANRRPKRKKDEIQDMKMSKVSLKIIRTYICDLRPFLHIKYFRFKRFGIIPLHHFPWARLDGPVQVDGNVWRGPVIILLVPDFENMKVFPLSNQ
ncbi:hypothetical protein V1477_001486 [Vespula maculifrons]|uniref:Uncharacterized protein n=1 Tax=Vespula maculifrons TaxID=7453 RepID=A0ABD2CYS2_VESMC